MLATTAGDCACGKIIGGAPTPGIIWIGCS
jgi:hypothetical protein